jgi:AcrR family transcriptional regulator
VKKGEQTKQSILKSALNLFANYGYENTSLKDIATDLNIKTPSLYNHFKSKDELFTAVINDLKDKYITYIDVNLKINPTKPVKSLESLFTVHNNFYKDEITGNFIGKYYLSAPKDKHIEMYRVNKLIENTIKSNINEAFANHPNLLKKSNELGNLFIVLLDGMFYKLFNESHETYNENFNIIWNYFSNILKEAM